MAQSTTTHELSPAWRREGVIEGVAVGAADIADLETEGDGDEVEGNISRGGIRGGRNEDEDVGDVDIDMDVDGEIDIEGDCVGLGVVVTEGDGVNVGVGASVEVAVELGLVSGGSSSAASRFPRSYTAFSVCLQMASTTFIATFISTSSLKWSTSKKSAWSDTIRRCKSRIIFLRLFSCCIFKCL